MRRLGLSGFISFPKDTERPKEKVSAGERAKRIDQLRRPVPQEAEADRG